MNPPLKPLHTWFARTAPLSRRLFLLGLVLSALAAWQVHRSIEAAAQAEFDRKAGYVQQEVARRLRMPLYGLRGALGTFAASERITRPEFEAYVQARDLTVEFPGVRGFGFIKRVPAAQEAGFVQATRADGAPWFEIWRLGAADARDRYVIKYIAPISGNAQALGLDVGS
jgi:CHASE1-domain containing sensor protein